MKLTQKQREAVNKKCAQSLIAAVEYTTLGLSEAERIHAIAVFANMNGVGKPLAGMVEAYSRYMLSEDFDAEDREARQVDAATKFGRDDFLHCEPTIDPNRTYIQQLEIQRVEMLEKLAALQTEIQTQKDGLAFASKKRYVDGLRQMSADPRAMAAKRANESVVHSVKASLDRQTGKAGSHRRLREAEDIA